MKKAIPVFILCAFIFVSAKAQTQESSRLGLLVAQLQDPDTLSSRSEISKLINIAAESKVDILFVQIYRANRSWFASKFADERPYQACLKNVSEDPFGLLIKEAHSKGIKVYAWVNLLSLSNNRDALILQKYGTGILTKNLKEKKKLSDYKIDDQYFLEPGDPRVRHELSSIVEEILLAYADLDGILFDYIRYPDKNADYGYTGINIERFKNATGSKEVHKNSSVWKDWKHTQVNELLTLLVKKTRALRPGIQVGATACAPYERAYYEAFQDWSSWANAGLVDFILLMSYPNNIPDFNQDIQEAKERVKDFKKVYIGVPAYKLAHAPEVFRKQCQVAQSAEGGAYVIFHYGSLLENPALINLLSGQKKK
jgi:uncharacterized lipoprotein YddW (UPF0748 family)